MRHLTLSLLAISAVMTFITPATIAQSKEDDSDSQAKQLAIIKAAAPSVVVVEYTLKTDKGEYPQGATVSYLCPNCGQYHTTNHGENLIDEQRPLETVGFLVSPDRVVSPDVMIHDRFIKSISVRFGETIVTAKRAAYGVDQHAVFLKLDQPLPGAAPLRFEPTANGPYRAVNFTEADGQWIAAVKPLSTMLSVARSGRQFIPCPAHSLITSGDGIPVALTMNSQLSTDESWKGSPDRWSVLTTEQHKRKLDELKAAVDSGLVRVMLNLRSPRKDAESAYDDFGYDYDDDGNASATVIHALGVRVDDRRVLVLSALEPKVTARLEHVRIFAPDGTAYEAQFTATLKDYGALVATLPQPLPGALKLAGGDILANRDRLLHMADTRVVGEQVIRYFSHNRIDGFEPGWRRNLYPMIAGATENAFLFNDAGELVVLPIARRLPVASERGYGDDQPVATTAAQLAAVFADIPAHADPANVPLSEEEEHRIAWLGVALQPLDRELARANEVSHLTQDGATGGIVTMVYPDSPAAAAGIEPGAILLRLHVEGQPKPIDIQAHDDRAGYEGAFPWDRLGEVPEEYFDRIPSPWPSLATSLNRTLTDLGFGTKFELEMVVDGERRTHAFAVTQSPPHYDMARRFKSDALGITVRELTFEVRQYLQRDADDPCLIVAKIEPGSKASIAGIKPYEQITQVNGQPVRTVEEFEKAIAEQTEVRLAIQRMTSGRQVRVKLDAPGDAPAPQPNEADPDADN